MSGGEWKKQPSDVASCRSLEPGGLFCLFGHHVRCNSSSQMSYDHARFRVASCLQGQTCEKLPAQLGFHVIQEIDHDCIAINFRISFLLRPF